MANVGGWQAEDMLCPGCGTVLGHLRNARHEQMSNVVTLDWACVHCWAEWETNERYGQPQHRVLLSWRTSHFQTGWTVSPATAPAETFQERAKLPDPEQLISGSVIGYRAWRIQQWQLVGTYATVPWHPGINEAHCGTTPVENAAAPHRAPAPGCHCGMTALARFDTGDAHWKQADVFGAIEAWSDEDPDSDDGLFFLHRNGFRAQYAKIVLLAIDDEQPAAMRAAIRALAQEHHADTCKREHLEDAAREHGQLIPDDLLEWATDDPPTTYEEVMAGVMASYQHAIKTFAQSFANFPAIAQLAGLPSSPPVKGLKKILRTPGPPGHGKYQLNDRVRDSKGAVWRCVKPGRPGTWEEDR